MSTVQSFSYEAGETSRLRAEIARRQLGLARQRCAAAATQHQLAAQQLVQQRRELQATAAEAARTEQALGRIGRELSRTRGELVEAQRALRSELDRAAQLDAGIAMEEVGLAAAIAGARRGLGEVAAVADAAVEHLGELSPVEGEALQARSAALEDSVRQLESEVRFLTADAAAAPAALVTLLAMESNGYRLRDTLSREGLVSYFEREGERHRLAVRMAPVARPGESREAWELVAETFGMEGEDCLYEIEDFATAVEELELGTLLPEQRVFPKDQRGGVRLPRLPEPPVELRRRPALRQERRRERE